MVSKSELKKRMQKRAKKAATEKAKANAPPKPASTPKAPVAKTEEVIDVDSIFKEGFLNRVYEERPVKNVVTRFPPEPNGFLHVGHAKAIAINFGFARYHGGVCNLRFDDTNPEAEEEIYFTKIQEMVSWLGFTPAKITYSSDSFQELYDLAEKLVEMEKAYVCHCDDAAIKAQRGGEERGPRFRCEHAQQSVEHNLREFRKMRDGGYRPREAFLRMKMNIEDGNPQLWDLAAYRVLDTPHYRTGDKWKIYPTYDFTHCIIDSFEGITHSLCTTEFILSRVSYEWLNSQLKIYEPMQREYGRLSIQGTVLSKRKIAKLVNEGYVRGWNDPRLATLIGIKRRGVPPGAILDFVSELGVTTSVTTIQLNRFEQTIRRYLEKTTPRLAVVLNPLKVVIQDAEEELELDIAFSPYRPEFGKHKVHLTKTVYIDASDFKEEDDANFYRLTPNQSVGLLQAPYPIKVLSITKDPSTGAISQIDAAYDKVIKKPKTYIQWVNSSALPVEIRMYNSLFKSDKPDDAPGGFLNDINPASEEIFQGLIEKAGFEEVKARAPWPEAKNTSESTLGSGGPESVRFQGLRVAYFCVDEDSRDDKVVLNRIVTLKEDAGK